MAIIISKPRDSEMCPVGKHLSDGRICVDVTGFNIRTNKIFYPENLLYLYWNDNNTNYPPIPINAVKRGDDDIFPAHHNINPVIHFWLNYWKNQSVTFPEGLDPLHIKAMIAEESSFNQDPPGSTAAGLMQITKVSFDALGGETGVVPNNYIKASSLEDLKDPVVNISAGIRWLGHKHHLLRFRQDRGVRATIAAYNGTDAYAGHVLNSYDLSK